jgi:hypothetical protein
VFGIKGLGLGFDGVFWMCTGITVVMLLVHMGFFTKAVEQRDRVATDAPAVSEVPQVPAGRISLRPAPKAAEPEKTLVDKIKELPFLDPRFMFFIFILLPVRTLFAHQFLTMPDYVFRAYAPEVSAKFEWIAGLNPFIIVIFVPLIAGLTRKVNIITMMIIGTAISAVTTFILVPGPSLARLIFYTLLFSLGEAVWSSRFLEYVADLAPQGQVGAYMGLAGIPWFLAKFTTGLYSGWMLERFVPKGGPLDTGSLWLIYALIACISPIGLLLARPWLLKHKEARAA